MDVLKAKLENLATQGVFGDGSFLRVVQTTGGDRGRKNFPSELEFLRVDMVPATRKIIKIPIVVKTLKTQQENDVPHAENGGYAQIVNEVTMYKNIIPDLGATDLQLCAKMFHGEINSREPEEGVVILEDLRPQGYGVTNSFILDDDHIVLAMNKLGQLHGLSYKLKKLSPEKLACLGQMLVPKLLNDTDKIREACLVRGFKPVVEKSPSYSVVRKVFKRITGMSFVEFISSLQEPKEPFAVITHGDYNGNNFMFKYDDSGKVVDMKMINFGNSGYLDPAVDISFCLCLNTSPESRTRCWEDFLDSYWDGVTSVAGNPGFTKLEFHQHFAGRAIVGYGPSCFFLPMMMTGARSGDWDGMSPEEKKEYFLSLGGDNATAATAAIVSHLLGEAYLDAYLRNASGNQTPEESLTPGYTNITFNFA